MKIALVAIIVILLLFTGCKSAGEAFRGTTVKVCCSIDGNIIQDYTLEQCIEYGGKRVECPEGSLIPR